MLKRPNQHLVLNHYQQLMLRLSLVAPHNAVHVVSMNSDLNNQASFQHAISAVIHKIAIGQPTFSKDLKTVAFSPLVEPIYLESCAIPLDAHVNNEINYLFSINEFPLRFFIISYEANLYFSITYNHWIGDAYSISQLITAIFTHLLGGEPTELTLQTPNMADCYRHIYKKRIFYYRTLAVIQTFLRFSPAFRTPITDVISTEAGDHFHVFDKDVLLQLISISKAQNITLNDLFISVLATLFGRITQKKRDVIQAKGLKPKRNRIIIAVISNLRHQSRLPLSHVFGLFLGFFYLSFKAPEHASFNTLSQFIRSNTLRLKRKNAAVKQFLLFKVQNKLWDSTKTMMSKYRLFSKNTPITVGISNMDLDKSHGNLQSSINQYIRFSPTAMVCPMVFNLTTMNGYLSLGLSFRKACYTPEEALYIKERFIKDIHSLLMDFDSLNRW